ncbi:hypothetical protein DES53_10963 [Roseimicrobium gellanilyticum]|uniref:Uncharacterized protein n=1 Tax=Roseimicrobium gellanilyticum TaxID=748857 RepID=A0A366HBF3_9BACT|nr:hypothetical protein [Roseimicrobium gellanilyticum]RBP39636.1 hypothetical protein DES53_10963 [Roseimicrobium gellanilyticum]
MTTHDHPPLLPHLLHELPAFLWEGQASPRVYLRDMTGRRGWCTKEEAALQDSDTADWYFDSHYAALAA